VRLPTVRRRSLPTVVGGGLAAVSVAIAVIVATLSGTHGGVSGLPGATRGVTDPGTRAAAATASSAATGASLGTPSTDHPASLTGAATPKLVVPDVIASVPGGVTKADLAAIKKLAGVRAVLAIDGARIKVNGTRLTVLAAPAAALRPWMPPETAASQHVWAAFSAGSLITTEGAATSAKLVTSSSYPASAAVTTRITAGGAALLGVAGVDGIVSEAEGKRLGLVSNVAVLVNAPAANVSVLVGQVQAALGGSAQVIRLVPVEVSTSLPVVAKVASGRPTSYLPLFQQSAARYCPGLSWTVLAAIGQIESADGQNMGPSTAGALGPMQFLPSTWKIWGIAGFGDTGAPNIWNPYDAVPSAARLLCADGATAGSAGLRQAIFDYNHADWYVDEVLTLAGEYAREYP
jgi:Transglycosylase SLT domain